MDRAAPPRVSLDELRFVGAGLNRPECVLATARGDLYSADWRGGVAHIRPDGSHTVYASALPGGRPLRPNGIALRRDGSFLLADLGDTLGGVFTLTRSGEVRPFLESVDGIALPPTNFVGIDAAERVWITVSTTKAPRILDFRPDCASGFIVLADERGARIVADGLGYTNEAVVSPDGLVRLSGIAVEAGRATLAHYREGIAVEQKQDRSPVTAADVASGRIRSDRVRPLAKVAPCKRKAMPIPRIICMPTATTVNFSVTQPACQKAASEKTTR